MKIQFKRMVSFLTSAVMTISALSFSGFSANAETNDSQQQTSDIRDSEVQYGGILGSMLSDEINESVESKQEAESLDYTVYKISHDPDTAYVGVDYKAKNDCTLFVGFYNDEGTELLSSVTKELQATDMGSAEVNILDVLPDHYLIKAFIIGKELLNPLSKPCYYNKYTKQMQEILAATTDDFAEKNDKVVNLDDDNSNNFFVLQDDVIDITPSEDADVYKGKDENEKYIFENPVKIAELKKGDKVFVRSLPEMAAFIVDSIETDGNTVVISSSDFQVSDFFKFIKIDKSELTDENNTDNSNTKNYQLTRKQYPQPFCSQTEFDDSYALPLPTIKSEFDLEGYYSTYIYREIPLWDLSGFMGDIGASNHFNITVQGPFELYYDLEIFGKKFISVSSEIKVTVDIAAELSSDKFTFPQDAVRLPIFESGVINIYLHPQITLSLKGAGTYIYEKTVYLNYDPNTGFDISSTDPATKEATGQVVIEFKMEAAIEVDLFFLTIFKIVPSAGVEIGIENSAEYPDGQTGSLHIDSSGLYYDTKKQPTYIRHDCKYCYNGFFRAYVSIEADLCIEVWGIEELGVDYEIGSIDIIEAGPFYFHINDTGMHRGKCDNYSHKIKIEVIDSEEKNKPVPYVKLYKYSSEYDKEVALNDDYGTQYKTDKDGEISFFVSDRDLNNNSYDIIAKTEDGKMGIAYIGYLWDSDYKGVKEYTIDISSNSKRPKESLIKPRSDGKYVTDDVDTITGVCGYAEDENGNFYYFENDNGEKEKLPTVYYSIYPDADYDNVCYIYGGGIINAAGNIPSNVDKIVIADNDTKLGKYTNFGSYLHNLKSADLSAANMTEIAPSAFANCQNLKEIKFPLRLEKICGCAFQGCKSLKSINLPATVKYINTAAFNGCVNLTSFTAPSSLKEIGYQAFWDCNNLREVNLNYGLEYIASEAFLSTKIKSINIPSTVTKIGYHEVFADGYTDKPRELRTVIINSDFDVVKEENTLNYYENKCVIIDDSTSDSFSYGNSYDVFDDCVRLNTVIFNKGVTKINDGLFTYKPVSKVSLPSTLKEIGRYAFFGTKLTSISLPDGLASIGEYAFNTTGLSSITFPNSLETIGEYSFANSPLANANVNIPENVNAIGAYAFGNTGLHSITINNRDCTIGEGAIPKGKNYIVYGHDGSTAQAFAESNNNTFISLDKKPAETTTTAVTTTTAATTTVTATVSTVISPQKECVFVAVNDPTSVNSTAQEILDVENVAYFDQQTADENGTVIFSFVPEIVDLTHIFISEITDSVITKTVEASGKVIETTKYTVTEPTTAAPSVTLDGDANNDGRIDMADAVCILQALANPNKYGISGTDEHHITEQGQINADVYHPGTGITNMDALTIQKYLVKLIDTLPVYP
ncbi:leucine-rich repeat protein [uncultured Ruminococcus sp.]|uniref:leucine-rich repeat protein n=1 Tax=uncultured Ruminococcus sp. TaxID=165186 RepID=UPI0025D190A8|nr:leucine-rich repeat protein [uncultured Ruminococcus sp.]